MIKVRLQLGYSSKFLCLWNTPAMLLLWLCYAAVVLLLWFYDAPDNLMLLLYYAYIILLMIPQKETTTIQWICQPPISKTMKQLAEKKNKTNQLAIGMMQVCVQMFNNCFVYYCLIFIIFLCLNCFSYTYQLLFVGYKAWTRLITVLVQFKVPLDVIWGCCY